MAINLPRDWQEVDRTEEFASSEGMAGPITEASRTFEGPDGRVIVVADELDKPIDHQEEPRFQIMLTETDGLSVEYGHTETSHERMETAVGAIAHMAKHL